MYSTTKMKSQWKLDWKILTSSHHVSVFFHPQIQFELSIVHTNSVLLMQNLSKTAFLLSRLSSSLVFPFRFCFSFVYLVLTFRVGNSSNGSNNKSFDKIEWKTILYTHVLNENKIILKQKKSDEVKKKNKQIQLFLRLRLLFC